MPTSWLTDRDRSTAGFTLFEMLVVLAIVGIIAAVAAPRLGKPPASLERARQVADIRSAVLGAARASQASGTPRRIAFAASKDSDEPLRFVPLIDQTDEPGLWLYPDGSSNGGIIIRGETPILEIDWLTSEVRDAP